VAIENNYTRRKTMSRISGWSRAVLTSLALTLSTLALGVQAAQAEDGTVIWETREGYVAVVPQDTAKVPNNQPVELSDDLLLGILGSIQVRNTSKEKPIPLFTEGMLQLLTPHLRQALQKAGPNEDVTFLIVGLYRTLFGLGNRPMVTSGRMFYQNGKLNIVFGVIKQELRYSQDSTDRDFRLIAIGSRQTTAQGEWSLVPGEELPFEQPRRDWVVLDTKAPLPVKPMSAAPGSLQGQTATPMEGKGASRPLAERLATLNELKSKGMITDEEYAAKKREMLSGKGLGGSYADRLVNLNELKNKGLITDEEYRAKRLEILNEL
jgi:hypothetical protein